jgi:hypothetical protein
MSPITDFRISGLPAEPFQRYFAMTDAELRTHGASRVVASPPVPGADLGLMPPCRVSLRDAAPGESSILLHYAHHTSPASPYRASGPIYVREGVTQTAIFENQVPAQQRTRLLSVRAYDADGIMVDAEVAPGEALAGLIARCFARGDVAFLHAHTARRGCYSCRIDRV